MHSILPDQLWIGPSRDLEAFVTLTAPENLAIVDLAIDELVHPRFRDIVYLRIPLIDGPENPTQRLQLAVDAVVSLVRGGIPAVVVCSLGMSRSPAIAAGALARLHSCSPEEALMTVSQAVACDVSPGLWKDLLHLLEENHDR